MKGEVIPSDCPPSNPASPQETESHEAKKWAAKLESRDSRERLVAEEALVRLGSEAIHSLLSAYGKRIKPV